MDHSPSVLNLWSFRGQKHDVTNDCQSTAKDNDWATGFDPIRDERYQYDHDKASKVGGNGEQLRYDAFVSEAGDDGR